MTVKKRCVRCGLPLVETWPQFFAVYADAPEWERSGWLFMQQCCQCDDAIKTRQTKLAT